MALNTHLPHTVYTRQLWGDAWFQRDYLYADQFSFACGPSMSEAVLVYKYGQIMRPELQTIATYTPLDLGDRYVKIVVDGGPTWYGIVIDQVDDRQGESVYGGNEVITGKQTFICRGMEYLLQRKIIDTSVVETAVGTQRIDRAISFNLGGGLPSSAIKEGNASLNPIANGSRVFAQQLSNAIEWDGYDILKYLIANHPPADKNGIDSFGWSINDFFAFSVLSPHNPTIHAHGKSLFQLLNELIDRRRLHGWYVYVDPNNNDKPQIRVFTFAANNVVLPDGSIIPAAQSQVANWDFDQENQVQRFTLASDVASKYDRVIARGEPQGGCFTVSFSDLIEIDWATALQTIYNAGDPGAAGLSDDWERHNSHQTARTKDYLKKVYRYFRISPTNFAGYVGVYALWPDLSVAPAANPILNTRLSWWPGLRLQDRLPLRTEYNYATPVAVTNDLKSASKWEYRRPFVYITDSATGKAFLLDSPGRGGIDDDPESGGRNWAASLRMQDDAFGFIVDAPVAHLIADNTFSPVDAADTTDYQGSVDYNYMSATLFAEGDCRVEQVYPTNVIANPDMLKELIIDVPHARLDYLLPNTVIDIGTDGLPITTVGGYVQDDTAFLANVARSAYEWYSQTRKSIQVTIHDLAETRTRGELILVVGGANNSETINSVVTDATYDMLAGTATYLTQFAELDAI